MEIAMDILLAGKAMSWSVGQNLGTAYDVRMKVLEGSSTPQNRLILCRADANLQARRQESVAAAQDQLDKAYRRAHVLSASNRKHAPEATLLTGALPVVASFCLGMALTAFALRK